MDKKKDADLARSYSVSCKKLVEDKQMMRSLTSPAAVVVSLAVTNLILSLPFKQGWVS